MDTLPAAAEPSPRPWLAGYPPGIDWDMALPPETMVDLLDETLRRFADRPCMDFLGARWSYRQFGALVARTAEGLMRLGAAPGVRVGLCLPNSPLAVIGYFAVLRAGAVVVNFSPLAPEEGLVAQTQDSGTTIMVTTDIAPLFARVRPLLDLTGLRHIVVGRFAAFLPPLRGALFRIARRRMIARFPTDDPRIVDFAALTARPSGGTAAQRPRPAPQDLAVLQYTGGTTGAPKGVMLTHANLAANLRQILAWFPMARPGKERVLTVLPLFHVFAMTTSMNTGIALGAELILLPRFEARQVLATLRRRRPTLFSGVPTLFKAILDAGATTAHLASVRICLSGGAPLPLELKRRFEAGSQCTLVEGYGLTEASPVCFCNPVGARNRAGTIGLALPGVAAEIRALEDPSRPLPSGERGELCVRGPNVMAGYWQRPEDSAAALTADGWLRTGDVGIMDADGYVTLVDRIKDLIICSGFNVYPRAIEEAVYRHPAVAAAVALGMPDAHRGESPAVFVQPRPGAQVTVEELRAFLADKLSPVEMPRLIEMRVSLPVTAVGKLSRTELRAELQKIIP